MRPMDLAMRLLKMPLLPESIKRVSDNRTEAQFQDPKTNQIYPMVAEKDPKFRAMNVGIYPNQPEQNLGRPTALGAMGLTDEEIDDDIKEEFNIGLSNAELTETNEDGPYYESDMTWTDPEKRRRGYASALYDLVDELDERKVRPSANQSDEGKQLWRKRMRPKGEPMDLAWRLLKAPYDVYTHEGNQKKPFEGTLYAGGDVTDTPKYYTPSLEGALDYAVYGSATGDVPMRSTTPAIRTVQDPGFNEKGQPAGSLIADPQLQDAYMQDDDSPLQSELMDDDTLRQLILQMSDKSPKSDTTGYHHSQQDREKHIQGALERLKNKTSGRLDLTDSQKMMGGISTGRHDELDMMDFDDINSGWDFLEDWEKSWLLDNRFDELPMWLQEEHQDEVKTGEPMDLAFRLLKASRQTELGEFHEDLPSSHGPVTGYRALSDEQHKKIPHEGLTGTPIKPLVGIRDNPPKKGIYAWMGHTPTGLDFAREQAQNWANEMSNNRDTPSRVVGIRGRHDLSHMDDFANDWYGITEPEDLEHAAAHILPHDIPPEQVVRQI